MERKEQQFRNFVIQKLDKAGIYALPMEVANVAGFPDVLVLAKDEFLGIELKQVEGERTLARKIKNIFKPSQPSFYLNLINRTGTDRLFVLVKINGSLFLLFRVTEELIRNMGTITFNQIKKYTDKFYLSNDFNLITQTIKELLNKHFTAVTV